MVISDLFSIITILMCLVAKVPQIRTLFGIKSAKGACYYEFVLLFNSFSTDLFLGISPLSLYLELFSYTAMMCYNYCNGYSLMSYLEYPVLLVQEYILIFLVLKYKRKLGKDAYIAAAGYFFITALCLTKILPVFLLAMLVVSFLFCIID